jgi:hypothetical protein
MAAVDRRAFLRIAASAGIATAATSGALAVEIASAPSVNAVPTDLLAGRLDAILADYLAEIREERRLMSVHDAAYATMPAWARPGPSHLLHDGTKGGPENGWPELAELPAPPNRKGGHVVIRMHPREYWRNRLGALLTGGECIRDGDGTITFTPIRPLAGEARRKARLEAIVGMRELIARVRQQRVERCAAGLPQIEAALSDSNERMNVLRDRLQDAATGASPAALAATALVEATFEVSDLLMVLLERTAPHLTGLLRLVVDDFLARRDDGYYATIFGTGDLGGLA